MPYGFPTGRGLLDDICAKLKGEFLDTEWGERFVDLFGRRDKAVPAIREFRKRLYNSSKDSVDAFLEKPENEEFIPVGKIAIAAMLVPCEDSTKLISTSRSGPSWYAYLFNSLDNDSSFEKFGDNKLSILTYNYDRSLEEFLYISLKNLYDRSAEETANVLRQIPIVHLHGALGAHPSQDGNMTRDYSSNSYVPAAAEGIKIVHEIEPSGEQFRTARHLLTRAERICFLGFGYGVRLRKTDGGD